MTNNHDPLRAEIFVEPSDLPQTSAEPSVWDNADDQEPGVREDGRDPDGAEDSFDPLKIYLETIGSVPLLKHADERRLFERIEEDKESIIRALFSLPFYVEKLPSTARLALHDRSARESIFTNTGQPDNVSAQAEERFMTAVDRIGRLYEASHCPAGRRTAPDRIAKAGLSIAAGHTERTLLIEEILSLRLKFDFVSGLVNDLAEKVRTADAVPARQHKGYRPVAIRHMEQLLGAPRGTAVTVLAICEAARSEMEHTKGHLVEANLRLVVSVAKRYMNSGKLGLSDLRRAISA